MSLLAEVTGGTEAPPEDENAGGTPYDIIIACKGWGTRVGAYRTEEPILPALGYGGHPVAVRPKKSALTVFEGRQPFQMPVPLLFSGNHVPRLCFLLDQMASARPPTPEPGTTHRSLFRHGPQHGRLAPAPRWYPGRR